MRAFFSSPRRRRRAIKLGVVLLAALGVGLLIAFQRNTVHVDKAANRFSNTPATVYPDLKQVRLPRSEYYKARDVAIAFIATAVERKHLERSCALVTRKMMEGMTCRQWQTQDIPVVPYPVDETLTKYSFDYSFKNSLGMKFAVFPKPPARVRPSVFRLDLERTGPRRPWLVDDWQPAGVPAQLADGGSAASSGSDTSLAATWLLVPAGIFGLLVLVPIVIGLRGWWRARRADRQFPPGSLPPLRS